MFVCLQHIDSPSSCKKPAEQLGQIRKTYQSTDRLSKRKKQELAQFMQAGAGLIPSSKNIQTLHEGRLRTARAARASSGDSVAGNNRFLLNLVDMDTPQYEASVDMVYMVA